MISHLRHLSLLLLLAAAFGQLTPLYWEINPNYQLPVDTAKEFAAEGVAPNNVSINNTESVVKYTYSLTGIDGKSTYDGSKRNVTTTSDSITVNNNLIKVNFTYDADSKDGMHAETSSSTFAKEYKGIGNATLTNLVVNFTKVLGFSLQKLAIVKGQAVYTISNLKYDIPKALTINEFYPAPNKATNTTLWKLASENLLKEVNDTIGGTIVDKFDDLVADESLDNTFGTNAYKYVFGKYVVNFNSSMSKVAFNGAKGNVVGYDMAVVGLGNNRRSTFEPPANERASYITLQLVQNLFDYQSRTPEWQSMRVDSSMLISDMFQFYLIDLESIVPEALNKYPNLLSKLYASCGVVTDVWSIKFDTVYQLVKVTANWNCSLRMQDGDAKLLSNAHPYLDVMVPLSYDLKITQPSSTLKVYITNAALVGEATWTEEPDLPIANSKLANLYLKSLLGPLSGRQTIGTGFPSFTTKSEPYIVDGTVIKLKELAPTIAVQ